MLLVHEVHAVAGVEEDAFADLYRHGFAPALTGDEARLLWYLVQAHGTGPAYHVVTVTGVADGAAWQRLADRVDHGDLRSWRGEVDRRRHDHAAKVLRATSFSPTTTWDLADVPLEPPDGGHVLFMEDTAWPHRGHVDAYLALAEEKYLPMLRAAAEEGRSLLELVAAFQPAFGAGRTREIVLWQRVARPQGLLPLFSQEVPADYRAPGTWMHDALDVRDRWESRLLRTASWSPLH